MEGLLNLDQMKIFEFQEESNLTLDNLLKKALLTKGREVSNKSVCSSEFLPYWNEDHYKIGETSWWAKASVKERDKFLFERNRYTLNESMLVENLGFTFNSKMMLLHSDLNVKSLYANFAFDEVSHLQMLKPFLFFDPFDGQKVNPLLQEVGRAIECCDREVLAFIIQVILEGFGIAHYTSLAHGCLDFEMKGVLEGIVKDEAFHHGGGLQTINYDLMTKEGIALAVDILENVLTVLTQWTHPHLRCLALSQEGISREQALLLVKELNGEEVAFERIMLTKKLIAQHAKGELREKLLAMRVFDTQISSQLIVDQYFTSCLKV